MLIVAPALNSRLRHYLSDIDAALVAARTRSQQALDELQPGGLRATGRVGDSDPHLANVDALTSALSGGCARRASRSRGGGRHVDAFLSQPDLAPASRRP